MQAEGVLPAQTESDTPDVVQERFAPQWPGERPAALASTALGAVAVVLAAFGSSLVAPALVATLALVVFAAAASARARWLAQQAAEAQARAEEAAHLAALGLATAGFAHELRNGLMVVRGWSVLAAAAAAERHGDDRPLVGQLRELDAQARRLLEQLESHLRLARGEGATRCPRPAAELVREIAGLTRPLAALRGLLLECAVDEHAGAVDDVTLRRALLDLVLNALDHARTKVRLVLQAEPSGVLVTVEDDGPGVPAPQRERVFARWESARPGGTGLGLAAVRDGARREGGSAVCVESALGGARFEVRLAATRPSSASVETGDGPC